MGGRGQKSKFFDVIDICGVSKSIFSKIIRPFSMSFHKKIKRFQAEPRFHFEILENVQLLIKVLVFRLFESLFGIIFSIILNRVPNLFVSFCFVCIAFSDIKKLNRDIIGCDKVFFYVLLSYKCDISYLLFMFTQSHND